MARTKDDSVTSERDKGPSDSSPHDELDATDEDCYDPITPSDFTEKAKEINRNLQESHQHKTDVVKTIISNQTPSISSDLGNRLGNLRLSFSLVTVVNLIADNQFRQARKQAQKALSLAHASNDKLSVARCRYWIGRIEFEKQNMNAAHDHFLAAQPCLLDDLNPEGETLQFYLNASKNGISEEYRKRMIAQHDRALVDIDPRERPVWRSNPSRKRKREAQLWDVVLRPASGRVTGTRQKQSLERSTAKPPGRLHEWIVRDMPDLPLRPKDSSGISKIVKPASHNGLHNDSGLPQHPTGIANTVGAHHNLPLEGMSWLQTAISRPCLEQLGEFTLRCYPVGLAPRTRPTNLFSKLPDEVLLSAQEWESLKKLMGNRAITMAYLARERQLKLSNKA